MAVRELRSLLDIPTIEALAGRRSFERGVEYVGDGRVGTINESDDAIEATVRGTDPYVVRISAANGQVFGYCSCPMGEGGAFCKHCVALSLVWVEPAERHEPPDGDLVRAYLKELDHDELVALIEDEMAHDETLGTRIGLRAEAATADGLKNLRRALDRATAVHGFLDYAEAPTWAAGVDDVADAIESAIDQGHAAAVIGLAERGLEHVSAAIHKSDDSDGYHGGLLRRFEQIHLAACRVARPDPVKLAQDLFRQELESDWDVFAGAAERYVDVLGEDGLAEYRRLAEAQWAKVPARGPNPDPDQLPPRQSHHDFTVTHMIESLARAEGDTDGLIAVMSRDLSSAYCYLELARVCCDAGRADEALEWAERGVKAFPARTDSRLVEFLTDAYLQHDRGDEAMALAWKAFEERPELESYKLLKRAAEGTDALDPWRPRAFERVRAAYRDPEAAGTTLVTIHDWETDYDAAWAAVHELGCDRRMLSRLAKRTEDSHPDEAIAAFRAEVSEVLRMADRRNYAEAVGLLRRTERISIARGRQDEFRAYAASVREDNKRRPAFCSMFDAARFP